MNNPVQTSVKHLAIVALFWIGTLTIQTAQAAEKLYHREINQKNPGGKDLVMTFEEASRTDKTSTVKVTMTSGASVPSVMFIMRGVYDIAKIRKMNFLIKLSEKKEKDGSWKYVFGFSNDDKVNTQVYFDLKENLPNNEDYTFMAVQDLDAIFEEQ